MEQLPPKSSTPLSFKQRFKRWTTRIAGAGVLAVAVVMGLALTTLFFAVFLVLALVGSGVLWWKTRHWRREQRRRAAAGEAPQDPVQDFLHRRQTTGKRNAPPEDIVDVEYREVKGASGGGRRSEDEV
ncbi:MAG: hypothetical protein ACFCBW_00180 [Candidatus Competibacterales bacterium]